MKTTLKIQLLLLLTLFSCSDNNSEPLSIIDDWTYTEDATQTILFVDASNALVNNNEFTYEIDGDKITFRYAGPLFIAIIPSTHSFELSNNSLLIEDLNSLQFFEGEEGANLFTTD